MKTTYVKITYDDFYAKEFTEGEKGYITGFVNGATDNRPYACIALKEKKKIVMVAINGLDIITKEEYEKEE